MPRRRRQPSRRRRRSDDTGQAQHVVAATLAKATGRRSSAAAPCSPSCPCPTHVPPPTWEIHPALSEDRLRICARLLAHARRDAIRMASYEMGDTTWSVGCRAYAFGQQRMRRVAEKRTYNWLSVLDQSNHFVFLIQDVPVRFFRGSGRRAHGTHPAPAAQRGAAARPGTRRGPGQRPGVPPRAGGRGGRGRGPGGVPRPARRGGARRVLLAGAARRGAGTGTPGRAGPAAFSSPRTAHP